MNIHHTILTAALALAIAGPASAESLKPVQAQWINLGAVSGVAYYTVEKDGFRVIVTLAQDEDAAPVRMEAVLAPGQSIVLSSPHGLDLPSEAVEISRKADEVIVHRASTAVTN